MRASPTIAPTGPRGRRGRTGPAVLALVVAGSAVVLAQESPFALRAGGGGPVPFRLRSHKVHLPVTVDGVQRWFLLDSGANVSILGRRLADELGLALRDPGTGTGTAGSGTFRFAFADAPGMRLGDLEILPRTMAVVERGTDGTNGHRSDGLLGADLLARFVVDVDYPRRTLAVHPPGEWAYRGSGEVVPLRIDDAGKPRLTATIRVAGGRPLEADLMIDTGDRGTVDLTAPFVAEHGLLEAVSPRSLATVGWGVSGRVEHWVGRLAEVRLGRWRWVDLPVGLAPADAQGASALSNRSGVLGGAVLERFRVIFDLPGGRLVLEPGPEVDAAWPWDASGLFLTAAGEDLDELRVLAVDADSPGAEAGVAEGERLLALDDEPVTGADLDAVRDRLAMPGRRLELLLEGADGRRGVTLETRSRI